MGVAGAAAVFLQPQDTLRIDTLAGDDIVDTSGLQRGLVHFRWSEFVPAALAP